MTRHRTYGFSFSPSRALGIAGAKASLSRKIGIPLTQGGRDRAVGRAVNRAIGWLILFLIVAIAGAFGR